MKRQGGFTLVEMLVVIAILGILMAMMVPAAGLIINRTKVSTAKSDAGIVVTTMMKYWMEYNRWPGLPEGSIENSYATDKTWVDIMAPAKGAPRSSNNFHIITFFEPGGGVLAKDGTLSGSFVDPWGTPFLFRVDRSGTGEVSNPNVDVGETISFRVVAWSAGPDKDFTTWKDNVCSWE